VEPTRSADLEDGVQLVSLGGKRSSQQIGKAVFADAVSSIDEGLARRILAVGDWRKKYLGPVRDVVVAGALSAKNALTIASEGLTSMRSHLSFVRAGEEVPLSRATELPPRVELHTGEIVGQESREAELTIPFRGTRLSGDRLKTQLSEWVTSGTLEPTAEAAIVELLTQPDWLDLSDQSFVLMGAASQMGPLEQLLSWGANVAAVDLPVPAIWDRIADLARKGSGRLTFPTRASDGSTPEAQQAQAGVDLLIELPEVASWLRSVESPFVIGNYVYADGAAFLRIAGAVDALVDESLRRGQVSATAYLATPTDAFAVPNALADQVRSRMGPKGKALKFASGGKLYQSNYRETIAGEEGAWAISDCLVPIQGPNYALAKSVQRWRAIMTREDGTISSANVAPATNTTSVTKNRMLAAAYSQAHRFGIEIFEPETSRALMAALLVHDLRSGTSSAKPDAPVGHPFDLFVDKAVHGGIWRSTYEPRSVLPMALLRGMLSKQA
jgi:hypothetical protein